MAIHQVYGPQGGAMVFYRLQIDAQDVPTCGEAITTVSPNGYASNTVPHSVRLRCGETLRMYSILPEGDCDPSVEVETFVKVEIEGIGSAEVMLRVPGDAFCSAFG